MLRKNNSARAVSRSIWPGCPGEVRRISSRLRSTPSAVTRAIILSPTISLSWRCAHDDELRSDRRAVQAVEAATLEDAYRGVQPARLDRHADRLGCARYGLRRGLLHADGEAERCRAGHGRRSLGRDGR